MASRRRRAVTKARFSPAAKALLGEVYRFWRLQDPAKLAKLKRDVRAAIALLVRTPGAGQVAVPTDSQDFVNVRRWLITDWDYHLYYRVDEAERVLQILAIWHTSRGQGPEL